MVAFKKLDFINVFIIIALISLIAYFIYLIARSKNISEGFEDTNTFIITVPYGDNLYYSIDQAKFSDGGRILKLNKQGTYIFYFPDGLKVKDFTLIIEKDNITIDGKNECITINDNTHGFIQNGRRTLRGKANITLQNINVKINGNIKDGGICQGYFGRGAKNNIIKNCSVTALNNSVDTYIGVGGICGENCGSNNGTLAIISCYYNGNISVAGGGICGQLSGSMGGNLSIISCYSNGTKYGFSGGICGEGCGVGKGNVSIISCYSIGNIKDGGGICGRHCAGGVSSEEGGNVLIMSCYSKGDIIKTSANYGGGICGNESGENGNVYIISCYYTGNSNENLDIVGPSSRNINIYDSSFGDNANGTPAHYNQIEGETDKYLCNIGVRSDNVKCKTLEDTSLIKSISNSNELNIDTYPFNTIYLDSYDRILDFMDNKHNVYKFDLAQGRNINSVNVYAFGNLTLQFIALDQFSHKIKITNFNNRENVIYNETISTTPMTFSPDQTLHTKYLIECTKHTNCSKGEIIIKSKYIKNIANSFWENESIYRSKLTSFTKNIWKDYSNYYSSPTFKNAKLDCVSNLSTISSTISSTINIPQTGKLYITSNDISTTDERTITLKNKGTYTFKFTDNKNDNGRYEVEPFTLIIEESGITIDGGNQKIKLSSAHDGIIQNGTRSKDINGQNNCHIKNIDIEIAGIFNDGGGICHSWFGKGATNNTITNCHVEGTIDKNDAGGICGTECGNKGNVTIISCYNSGPIQAISAGGICGGYCGDNGNVIIKNCYNSGAIEAQYAGGICGYLCGYHNGNVAIENCYNSGAIQAKYAGGICGGSCGNNNGNVAIVSCYNSGAISSGANRAGGICGYACSYTNGNVAIVSCYNTGTITGNDGGGICGSDCGHDKGNVAIISCYNTGTITRDGGGICGSYCGSNKGNVAIVSCYTNNKLVGGVSDNAGTVTSYYNFYKNATNSDLENNISDKKFILPGSVCKETFPYNVIETLKPNELLLNNIVLPSTTSSACTNEILITNANKWWHNLDESFIPKITNKLSSFMNCDIWSGYNIYTSTPKLEPCPKADVSNLPANFSSLIETTQAKDNKDNNEPIEPVEKMTPMCNFEPYGSDENTCINLCSGDFDRFWQIEGGCNYTNCKRICKNCTNENSCPWLNKSQNDFSVTPNKLNVMAIEGDSKVELKWRCIDVVGDSTKEFVINYYKTFVPMEGVKVKKIERIKGQHNYTVVIDALENGTNYTIVVYQVNNAGDGPNSDQHNLIPNKQNTLLK